jgi:hypothetical protein
MPILMTLRSGPARVPRPHAASDSIREVRHRIEDGVDLVHDVPVIDDDRRPARRAQGDVQDRSPLRDVDPLSPKHGVDPRA